MSSTATLEMFSLVLFIGALALASMWSLKCFIQILKTFRNHERIKAVDSFGVFIGIGIGGCILYGTCIEPYQLEVTHWNIQSDKLQGKPIRIAHISDLHCDSYPRVEPRLAPTIKKIKPDIIVFSGDCINNSDGLSIFRKCMTEMSAIAPTYVSMGNHDTRQWSNIDLLKDTHATSLNGQIERLELHNTPVCITGVSVDKEALSSYSLNQLSNKNLNIYVYHYPSAVEGLSKYNVDLLCAGHTHGGQVRLPFYGAIITSSTTGKRFEAGMYQVGNTLLSVTRGVGLEGSWAPRIRFLCPPEVTVIDIVDKKRLGNYFGRRFASSKELIEQRRRQIHEHARQLMRTEKLGYKSHCHL